ncbi:MAG: hypothetical protein N3F05_03985 [Candidatus Diapherotrites archaeon]|nr:hypothetical protein [Candidatus Diapherotrites archaeon]
MSLVDTLSRISSYIPEVKRPLGEVPVKKRLIWSALALLIFFALGHIKLLGLKYQSSLQIDVWIIMGSTIGTLATAGIGPIVFASLLLQLVVGAKLLDIDLSDPKGRAQFQNIQKLAVIIFCVFEGFIYPMSGLIQGDVFLLSLQIILGSIIIFYLDDLIGKYGFGSGISLFIAGGVSSHIISELFMPQVSEVRGAGIFWKLFLSPNIVDIIRVIAMIILFLIVIYAQSIYINIPITIGRGGLGGRFPVRLLYVSVLPVIFASALFANISLLTVMFKDTPVVGDIGRALTWATGQPLKEEMLPKGDAGIWAKFKDGKDEGIRNLLLNLAIQVSGNGFWVIFAEPYNLKIVQAIIFLIIFSATCVIFGKLWITIGGQSPEDIAEQLESSGMYIPGFRRDSRVTVKILERYIPTIVVLGSLFIALLSGIGDMSLGALTSGTGILLTVGIIQNLYEQLTRLKVQEMHPLFKRLLK